MMIDMLRACWTRWGMWREQSINRRIFATALLIGSLTCIANVAVAAKELLVARQFGTSDVLDAFLIAFVLPSFAINVVAGSFNAAFVPTFVKVREQHGKEAAQHWFSGVMIWSTGILLVIVVLLALVGPFLLPVLGSGFTATKLALTRSLFFILLPSLMINGLSTIWAGVLNAGERFALVATTPMILPFMIMFLLVLKGDTWGIYALAVGTVGGYIPEAILLAWSLKRYGFFLCPRWRGLDPETRQVIRQYAAMATSSLLMGSTVIVDQAMAAMLSSGSVSTLNYGKKVVSFLLGIGSLPLSTAVLPHFS